MNNKILVLGYFGKETNQIDGQTIKTNQIYDLIYRKIDNPNLVFSFDTEVFKKDKKKIFNMLIEIFNSSKIIYLPGRKNFKFLLPLVYLMGKVFGKEIIYIAVGGWLVEYLKNLKYHLKLIKASKIIYVESKDLKEQLKFKYGISQVEIIPNFRLHSFKPHFNQNQEQECFKIVFMSRVAKSKGIDLIIRFIQRYIDQDNPDRIKIDFYGPIEECEQNQFLLSLKSFPIAEYKGIVEPQNVHSILNKYDCMVLPSHYDGEGFPGAIIDSYIAGIPVIVSKWKQLPEFVDYGVTGYYFDLEKENEFYNHISFLLKNRSFLAQMKKNAHLKSKEYSSEVAWEKLKINFEG